MFLNSGKGVYSMYALPPGDYIISDRLQLYVIYLSLNILWRVHYNNNKNTTTKCIGFTNFFIVDYCGAFYVYQPLRFKVSPTT